MHMSLERLAYLDSAFKTLGLSIGRPEADEISRAEERLGVGGRSGSPAARPEETLERLTRLDRHPLSGRDAQVLVAVAQGVVAQAFGLPRITPATSFLDIPGLGRTAVRVILRNPALGRALRIEARGLEEVRSYVLCEITFTRPEEVTLVGWAGREAVLGSSRVRLANEDPSVHVVGVPELRPIQLPG
jgi:hypothetical protein